MDARFFAGAFALAIGCTGPLLAQDGTAQISTTGVLHRPGMPAPVAQPSRPAVVSKGAMEIAAPAAGNALLATGTQVPLRLLEELTTKNKKLRPGSRFRLETTEPVYVDGVAVIPVGSPAVGEITEVRNKGMWGKSGRFVARVLYLTANGRRIRLAGEFDDKGVAGGWGATAVSAIVFLPAGFFMTGTSAHLPAGTIVSGFVGEDVPLVLPAGSGAMTVPEDAGLVPASASQ